MTRQKTLAHWAAEGRPPSCPACGSPRIARILYGLPAFDEELEEALSAGSVTLGGCIVTGEDPEWESLGCGQMIHASARPWEAGAKPERRAARPRASSKRSGR